MRPRDNAGLTLEQVQAIEDENEMLEVLAEEERRHNMKIWVPPMVFDGEETDAKEGYDERR